MRCRNADVMMTDARECPNKAVAEVALSIPPHEGPSYALCNKHIVAWTEDMLAGAPESPMMMTIRFLEEL